MTREDDPFDRPEEIGLAEARRRLEAPLARCDDEADPGASVDTLRTCRSRGPGCGGCPPTAPRSCPSSPRPIARRRWMTS